MTTVHVLANDHIIGVSASGKQTGTPYYEIQALSRPFWGKHEIQAFLGLKTVFKLKYVPKEIQAHGKPASTVLYG